jgi:glycosyltransferase involved in cell wall biosynthesis
MASYNGAAYIEIQLKSILEQLGTNDEVIVVDDCSSDQTLKIVGEFQDKRIRVVKNKLNLGVIQSFEKAIELAVGDIIFLSDQDDIWYPEKVERVLDIFEQHPDVTLVLSDAKIIDGQGNVTAESFFSTRGAFTQRVLPNLLKNKFLGCTMAFRRLMADKFLPFPKAVPMHDMWIGIVNEIYGKSMFISESLTGYRRHNGNVSPTRRQSFPRMLVWRWQLVSSLVKRTVWLAFSRVIGQRAN